MQCILASPCSCALLSRNPKDRFSRDNVQLMLMMDAQDCLFYQKMKIVLCIIGTLSHYFIILMTNYFILISNVLTYSYAFIADGKGIMCIHTG